MTLLQGGFVQLLPIVQWVAATHLEHIEDAARGTLAYGAGAPSEEEAMEGLLRIFVGRFEEADREAIENFMGARATEWFPGFTERRLLVDLVRRADRRKKGTGSEYDRRPPTHGEGLRIARRLLAGIPHKISLDAVGEYEALSQVLAALLAPPMGEPSPERLQSYNDLSRSIPVYQEALRRYKHLYKPDKVIFYQDFRWQRRADAKSKLHRAKFKVAPHSPVKPALLLRDFQVQFVIVLLDRVGVSPLGTHLSGCRIVGEALGLSKDTVKKIWGKRFTVEMQEHSEAIAERTVLLDTTAA